MNLKDARREFNNFIKPFVVKQYGPKDEPAINEAWGNYIDNLCRDGHITEKQYHNWTLN